jgi:hypothetical protein
MESTRAVTAIQIEGLGASTGWKLKPHWGQKRADSCSCLPQDRQ